MSAPLRTSVIASQGVAIGDNTVQNNYFSRSESAVEWPLQVGLEPRIPVAFQPRSISTHELPGPSESDSFLLVGDGGVGKTQMAAAIFRNARAEDVELCVWVDASSRPSIVAALAAADRAIRHHSDAVRDDEARAEAFLAWLATTKRTWLLIYDDVGSPDVVRGLWPSGSHGRVVATSRRRDLGVPFAVTPVGPFATEESQTYLRQRLRNADAVRPGVLSDAAALADALGHLPLALSQAAAVIDLDALTCGEYLTAFEDRSRRLDSLFPTGFPADEYPLTVASAWSLALDRANELEPVGIAGSLIEIAACFNPDGMPAAVWSTDPVLQYVNFRRTANDTRATSGPVTSGDVRRGLRNLNRLSVVEHDPAPDTLRSVRMHGLVQRSVWSTVESDTATLLYLSAAALVEVWETSASSELAAQVLRSNASAVMSREPGRFWPPVSDERTHKIVWAVAQSLQDSGHYPDGIEYCQQKINLAAESVADDHPDILIARGFIASMLQDLGDHIGALRELEPLVEAAQEVLGADDISTLAFRALQASSIGESGMPSKAVDAYRDLIADATSYLGDDHERLLGFRHNMAYWLGESGKRDEARAALEALLEEELARFGPGAPLTLGTRQELARTLGQSGDLEGALVAYAELISAMEEHLGPHELMTLSARVNMAVMVADQGDYRRAIDLSKNLTADWIKVFGAAHPEVFKVRNNIAHWRMQCGESKIALQEFNSLLRDVEETLGGESRIALVIRYTRAALAADDARGAAEALKRELAVQVHVLGESDDLSHATRIALVRALVESEQAEAGRALLLDHVSSEMATEGPVHHRVVACRGLLAMTCDYAGRPGEAARLAVGLLQDVTLAYGRQHPMSISVAIDLSIYKERAGNWRGAIRDLRELREWLIASDGVQDSLGAVEARLAVLVSGSNPSS